MDKTKKLILWVLVAQLAGFLGAIFITPSINSWYAHLLSPPLTPPNWVFAPVWLILYTSIGVGMAKVKIVSVVKGFNTKRITILFWAQLVFNSLWTIIFFGFHEIDLSIIILTILILTILLWIRSMYRVDQFAARIAFPYLFWCCFALYLNIGFWILN